MFLLIIKLFSLLQFEGSILRVLSFFGGVAEWDTGAGTEFQRQNAVVG